MAVGIHDISAPLRSDLPTWPGEEGPVRTLLANQPADPATISHLALGAHAVVTVTLFAFVMSWNEFLGALVMLNTDQSYTLPLILAAARQVTSLGSTDWGMLQAGVTIAIIPCVLIYLLLQRYYVSGLLSGAIK